MPDAITLLVASWDTEDRDLPHSGAREYLNSDPFAKGESACFVAYVRGAPAGMVIGSWRTAGPEPFLEVHNLFVYAEFRGVNVAMQLIRKVIDWAGGDDEAVVITTKGEPRSFYQKLGFEPTHRICTSTLQAVRDRLG